MRTNRFSEPFANVDVVLNGTYSAELEQLKGLLRGEVNAVVPASNNMQTYQVLIETVEKTPKDNLAQAQPIPKIESLDTSATGLAKKIPDWVTLL